MKEFKFRAWYKKTKKMFKVITIDFNYKEVYCHSTESGNNYVITLEWAETMQFTTLKDKNGKEIFEGDIVKCEIGAIVFLLRIVFEDGQFLAVSNDDLTNFPLFEIFYKCEIVGNIYENEKLLWII